MEPASEAPLNETMAELAPMEEDAGPEVLDARKELLPTELLRVPDEPPALLPCPLKPGFDVEEKSTDEEEGLEVEELAPLLPPEVELVEPELLPEQAIRSKEAMRAGAAWSRFIRHG